MGQLDRRSFTRYQVRIGAEVILPACALSAEIIEISLIGVRIHAFQAINPGTKVTVRIKLQETILFQGNVVWVLEDPDPCGRHYIIGIETDVMECAGIKAYGLAERTELLLEILYNIKEQAVNILT